MYIKYIFNAYPIVKLYGLKIMLQGIGVVFGGSPRGRKSNGNILILSKSKGFGSPVSMSATDLAPSLRKNTT